ncbi:MAG TPA: hypothetical protein V6C63_19080 [Allocoleopsis sp.]
MFHSSVQYGGKEAIALDHTHSKAGAFHFSAAQILGLLHESQAIAS